MKRMNFLIGMASAALVLGMAGCDSMATGAKKIAEGMTSYTIVLGSVANGATYTAVVYDGTEAIGGGVAEAVNDSASIKLTPANGKTAFSERAYRVQVSSGATVKEAAYVAFVAGGNTQLSWGTMTLISEETSVPGSSLPKQGVLTVTGAGDGIQYEADVYKYSKAVTDAAEVKDIISDADLAGTGVGTSDDGTLEISLITLYGEDFTSDGKFLVVLTSADDDSAPLKYKAAVTFIGGSATLKYEALNTAADDADGLDDTGSNDTTSFTSLASALAYLDAHTGGSTNTNPVLLKLKVNLASATDGWDALLNALASRNKYVALDLSDCSMSGTEFDLYHDINPDPNDGRKYIVSLVLPYSATSIVNSANPYYNDTSISDYSSLKTVSGVNITAIGSKTFYRCNALTAVFFPDVTTIETPNEHNWPLGAFRFCTSLTTVSFPEVTSIGDYTFSGCTALATISFPNATTIGKSAFDQCISLTEAYFPKATSVGRSAFGGCWGNLTSVSFPEATSIGAYAFLGCPLLTTASFPKATSIGSGAFQSSDTTPLTITMGSSAPSVGKIVFFGVDGTKNVTVCVPSGATGYNEAWQNAFKGEGNDGKPSSYAPPYVVNEYINLVMLYDGQSVPAPIVPAPSAPEGGFTSLASALAYLDSQTGGNTASVPVPLKLNVNLLSGTDGWYALVTALASRNKYVALDLSGSSVSNGEFDSGINGADVITAKIVSLVLPDSATSIVGGSQNLRDGVYASIKTVSGANITTIGAQSFSGCPLTTASFPKATSIGEYAFFWCTSLTTAYFPEATSIGSSAFYGCTSLATASFPKATSIGERAFSGAYLNTKFLTTASFPEATTIGNYAFEYCTSLTTVSIPKVTSIGYMAFAASDRGALTITMGNAAPTVGTNTFSGINGSRTVTIRVPNGATGYDAAWQTAFKGAGSTGFGTVNEFINVVFENY